MAFKFCECCNYPIGEGHILDYYIRFQYYCNENCLRKSNPEFSDVSMEDLYNEDVQYYTAWYDDDDFGLIAVRKVADTYVPIKHNEVHTEEDECCYWVLVNEELYNYGDSFTEFSEGVIKVFSTIDQAKEYYLNLKEC